MIPAVFIRLVLAALIFVGLRLAIPAFAAILELSVSGPWDTLIFVACLAVAVWYVFYGRPQTI